METQEESVLKNVDNHAKTVKDEVNIINNTWFHSVKNTSSTNLK